MNIFQQFIKSLYSPETIAKFRFQGIGKTILYVFLLMLITFSVAAFHLGSTVSTTVNQFQEVLENELPYFELNNSILTSDLDEPMHIQIDGDNFVFDTTGTLTAYDVEQQYRQAIALLETEAILITDGVSESFRYREFGNINLTKGQLEELTESIVSLLPLIISIIVLILYVVLTALKYIGIFVLSFIGLILKKNAGITIPYKQVWILSAYAVTLPTVFFAITDSLYIYIPFSFTLYWLVAIIMLFLIFREIPKPKDDDTMN
ncbi:hypothetical protein BKP35_03795 [Anaerobacillus arseniciselenatis]|uniref:DUF1189 domain-containing protein n=1 Tax=Anaerobacillus arseniciselenatis TaxID=85682 RepID=A0A1S2LV79_9BACI|nr:DUF1189 domain-containing protein [Anaerobacillus arseniciselenatis]OIJ16110.1 hypothetical protein BKP35_03795 [Anaerobacillus arseniciselenatis]